MTKYKPVSEPLPYHSHRSKMNWIVYYYDIAKRKRWRKCFRTIEEANDFVSETKILEMKYGMESCRISDDDKRGLIEAKRQLLPLGVSFENAILEYVRLSDELSAYGANLATAVEEFKKWNSAKERSTTLSKAVDKFYDSLYDREITELYRKKAKADLDRLVDAFGEDKIVSLINAKDLEKWMLGLKKRVYTNSSDVTIGEKPMRVVEDSEVSINIVTRNAYRRTLYTFFKYCKMQEWIDENPVERIAAWRTRSKTPEVFTPSEVRKILDGTEPLSEMRAYVAIAAFAGLRSMELRRLTWDKIKLEDREIVLDSEITKTASRRVVKITENLAKWLEPYVWELGQKKNVVGYGFGFHYTKLRNSFPNGWVKNGFRHSAATYYLALTKNAYLTAEQMGHAVDVLKQHYNGLAREKEALEYFDIYPAD